VTAAKRASTHASTLDLACSPEQVVARLGHAAHLTPIVFALGPNTPWSRWTFIALPSRTLRVEPGTDPFPALSEVFGVVGSGAASDDEPPLQGGWIGMLSYTLGRSLELRAADPRRATDDRRWPLLLFHRIDTALCYDKFRQRWWGVGDIAPWVKELGTPAPSPQNPWLSFAAFAPPDSARLRYMHAVDRAINYIRAGDIYQVNLAHRLSARADANPRDLFLSLAAAAKPWYGTLIPDQLATLRSAILCASPELLLRYDAASRTLTTRPMKGTRPAAAAHDLDAAPKDRAELAMIVDLMRNDLGRVASFGSVRVDEPRVLEPHGSLLQGVSSVAARLRPGLTLADAIPAIFPGGSVTGAPKIRAMQIIEELEEAPRGPYCGAVGYVSDTGDAAFAMTIRTLTLQGEAWGPESIRGHADYWVGAGIVADSDSAAEWRETLDKASPLRDALG
jgi:para-aminobenzoate synthetase component 1